jgi:serine/threonine protein kinase
MAGDLDGPWSGTPRAGSVVGGRLRDVEAWGTGDRVVDDGAPEWSDPVPAAVGGGRYQVRSLIGRGGSSEVFRGHDALLGRPVAIKLFPSGSAEPGELRRWREVRTLAGLNHPRLVSVYDAGSHLGRTFFVLQLVEGGNLTERLTAGPLTLGQALRLGGGLAVGLGHIHRHGVIHRDLKPANVLLDDVNRPYLTDFGIATWLGAAALTGEGLILGTPAFLAPEQVRGQPIGPAADVYALGLVLLECLTGRREYPGDPATAAAARLERPPAIPVDLPDPVATALRAMTHPREDRRPEAAELAEHFAVLLGSAAGDESRVRSSSRTVSRARGREQAVSPGAADAGGRPRSGTAASRGLAPRRAVLRSPRRRRGVTAGVVAGLVSLLAVASGVAVAHVARSSAESTSTVVAGPPGPTLAMGPAGGVGPHDYSSTPPLVEAGSDDRGAARSLDSGNTVVEPVVATCSHDVGLDATSRTEPGKSTHPTALATSPASKTSASPPASTSSARGKPLGKRTGKASRTSTSGGNSAGNASGKSVRSGSSSKHGLAGVVSVS